MDYSNNPKFHLGKVVITLFAKLALERSGEKPATFLRKHQQADWGDVCAEDKQANDDAIKYEGNPDRQQRVLSSYVTELNDTLWIITEWDRSITTILLPREY